MSDAVTMVGRAEVIRLIRECTAWAPPGRPLPVLVLAGPAGSGKTAILRAAQDLTERLHNAYVDVASGGFSTSARIVTELVAQLSLDRRGLSSLRFPRFLLGRLAVQLEFTDDSPLSVRQQVRTLLVGLKAAKLPPDVRELVNKAADLGVATFTGAPVHSGTADLLMSTVEATFGRRRTDAEKWWSATGRSAPDALIDLHRMTHRGARHEQQQAEDTLMQAFLADLRDSYADRLWRSQGAVASPVLVDNAHTEAGQLFLDLLVRARSRHPDLVDPLLVVVTTGRSLRDVDLHRPEAEQHRLGYLSWRDGWRPDASPTWYYPIRLRDLSEDEAIRWARGQGVYDRWTVTAVHRLAGGHSRGVVELLVADSARCGVRLLDVPDGTGTTLTEILLGDLLADVPGEFTEQLITCAAVRHPTSAVVQVALGEVSVHAADALRRMLTGRFWLAPRTPHAALHPFLRRLLLLHLQGRPDDHPDSWAAVHGRLRGHCLEQGDTTGARYHSLALGELAAVVADLDEALDGDGGAWLSELREVTSAPNRLPRTGPVDPRGLLTWPVAGGRTRTVAGLVAALWVQADPSTAGPRALRIAAYQFTELAGLVPQASDELFAMAEECRREADTYDA